MLTAIQQLKQEVAKAMEETISSERYGVYRALLFRLDHYEREEKQQIEAAYTNGRLNMQLSIHIFSYQYYTETYKND